VPLKRRMKVVVVVVVGGLKMETRATQ
jgi:hypothetical protein